MLKNFFNDIQDKLGIINPENIHKIHDCIFFIIYEQNLSKLNDKYSKYILEGNMTDKEKLYFDIFDKINDINIDKNMNGINIELLQSLFINNKIILIKLDIEYLKKNNITLEQINENIKFIQLNIPNQYQNLNIYIQIENKIINIINSYNKFLEELKNRNIIEQENKINIIKNNNDNINININNNNNFIDNNELLIKEKNNNKILKEKIKKLENELILEKDKNKLLEKNNIDLKKELENEIKNNNNLIKKFDEKKSLKSDWNKLNKISQHDLSLISLGKNWNALIEEQSLDKIVIKEFGKVSINKKLDNGNNEILLSMIKKDKEIEELKLKLSRFPFILNYFKI